MSLKFEFINSLETAMKVKKHLVEKENKKLQIMQQLHEKRACLAKFRVNLKLLILDNF